MTVLSLSEIPWGWGSLAHTEAYRLHVSKLLGVEVNSICLETPYVLGPPPHTASNMPGASLLELVSDAIVTGMQSMERERNQEVPSLVLSRWEGIAQPKAPDESDDVES